MPPVRKHWIGQPGYTLCGKNTTYLYIDVVFDVSEVTCATCRTGIRRRARLDGRWRALYDEAEWRDPEKQTPSAGD